MATVASITANNNKKLSNNPLVQNENLANAGDVLQEKEYEGALQVKVGDQNKTEVLKDVPNIQKVTTDNLTAPVSKSVNAKFEKPVVDGLLARAYSKDIDPVIWQTDGSYRTNLGIDIKAELGQPVVAVMDGIVKEVGTDVDNQKGKMVVIDHQNGFVTTYSNLDEKTLVKKGDKVTQKQQIATVGNTSLNSHNEKYGSHLHFEVLQSSKTDPAKYEKVDPAKYVKYDKYQAVEVKE